MGQTLCQQKDLPTAAGGTEANMFYTTRKRKASKLMPTLLTLKCGWSKAVCEKIYCESRLVDATRHGARNECQAAGATESGGNATLAAAAARSSGLFFDVDEHSQAGAIEQFCAPQLAAVKRWLLVNPPLE